MEFNEQELKTIFSKEVSFKLRLITFNQIFELIEDEEIIIKA